MSASVRFLRPRRMPLFVAIVPLPIGVFAIASPPGAELVYDVAAEPKKTAPPPKGAGASSPATARSLAAISGRCTVRSRAQ